MGGAFSALTTLILLISGIVMVLQGDWLLGWMLVIGGTIVGAIGKASRSKPSRSRGTSPPSAGKSRTSQEWLEALRLRLAKGEITKEQYEELRKTLSE
ncbi:MAG: SHOCT domain-containing protein [Thaumarchaeota archaeon]|nr:SHOCT domain-containing protein [Nitrososphaerota archaeon]